MASKEALLGYIQQFLEERGVILSLAELEKYNFVAEGALDSFEILTLTMGIETHFSLPVAPELLLDERNGVVGNLVTALMEQA
ncbi:hypothetical protein [Pseudoalteromonas luteoviolacea]|uniref:Carrier domain-containing protein n=1 Tax=Pseudoalteromonas luteoviolacea NCIMB 1942 TaxID=1365253 RepID=A0A167GEB4_9GAMM|nr:hypothetical protein [Pseudoalteromonas luteoviolacea]KZN54975.1 hypothetical protein N482_05315 [Pseudoalteromonas luteoviolacea NCIMB 1942]